MQSSIQRHDDGGEDEKDKQECRRQSAYQNEIFATKSSKKILNGGSDPALPEQGPDQNRHGPRTHGPQPQPPPPPQSPAQGSAIRRGAAGQGQEWHREARIRGRPPVKSQASAYRGALPHRRFCSKGCGFHCCGHRPPRVNKRQEWQRGIVIERLPRMRRCPHVVASHLN